jgi:predicted Zn-dependent peptidase
MGGWGDEESNPPPAPDDRTSEPLASSGEPREAPPVAPVGELTFPQVERATLSNGIEVQLARRTAVPQISLAMTLDAGSVVDPVSFAGVHETMVDLLSEGTTTRSALDIAIAQEQLGSTLSVRAGPETDTVALTTLTTNLAPSIELMADVVRNPAFRPDDVARVRAQRLAQISDELTSPGGLANRAFMPLVYGRNHPYAHASSAGDAEAVASVTRDALIAAHRDWIRPDLATIIAVGDVTMPQLVAALEASFGDWTAPSTPAPDRNLDSPAPAPTPRLVVIDRPNAPSSYLLIGRATPLVGEPGNMITIETANEVLGAGFLSRLMGDLREKKGWTYGIGSAIPVATGQRQFRIATQVQADRTADSIRVILDQMAAFPATRPVDEIELQRVTDGNIRGLPNRYETNAQVLGALVSNKIAGRDPRYQAQLPDLYRRMDAAAIDTAARDFLRPSDLTIVVVGDRQVIDTQLEALAMPITYLAAEDL